MHCHRFCSAEIDEVPFLLVNEVDNETMTALHWAAAYNEPAIIRLLLADNRVQVNPRNKRQGTPLHQACGFNAERSSVSSRFFCSCAL